MENRTNPAQPAASEPARRYFEQFLPGILGRLLIPELESLNTCFAIEVSDDSVPPWRIAIERGRLRHVGHDGPTPLCCFRLDREALLEVVSAELPPAEAFFAKRIDLTGDMELGLKLSTVLAPFFAAYPFRT